MPFPSFFVFVHFCKKTQYMLILNHAIHSNMQHRDEVFDTHPKALILLHGISHVFVLPPGPQCAAKQLFPTNTVPRDVYLLETLLFTVHSASSCFQRRYFIGWLNELYLQTPQDLPNNQNAQKPNFYQLINLLVVNTPKVYQLINFLVVGDHLFYQLINFSAWGDQFLYQLINFLVLVCHCLYQLIKF